MYGNRFCWKSGQFLLWELNDVVFFASEWRKLARGCFRELIGFQECGPSSSNSPLVLMSATSKFWPEGAHFHSIMLSRPFLGPRGTLLLPSIDDWSCLSRAQGFFLLLLFLLSHHPWLPMSPWWPPVTPVVVAVAIWIYLSCHMDLAKLFSVFLPHCQTKSK